MKENNAVDKALLSEMRLKAQRLHSKEKAFRSEALFETLVMLALALLLAVLINTFLFQIIRVEGSSMEPTFWTNERVFVDKLTYRAREPERGEVVICRYTINDKKGRPVIKRVIGLPGEKVEIVGGMFYIDDVLLDESAYWNGVMRDDMPAVTVPEDHIFVSGDNRDVSQDSRNSRVGTVSYKDINGRARFIVWPIGMMGRFAE